MQESDPLIFASVIFRHGERNILDAYPNDPYNDESYWPEGFGQLTHEGKNQLFKLGQYFRRRYDKLLGKKYSPNKIYIQSTDIDRTIMSAQACLAGLFPPDDDDKLNGEILWQPIPVHTKPLYSANGTLCEKHDAAYEKFLTESPELQKIYREHADFFTHLTEKSGEDIETVSDVYYLHNTLSIEKSRHLALPDWAEKVMEPNGIAEHLAKLNFTLASANPQLARLKSGILIKEIMDRFTKKLFSALEPNRSLWLYSAHDDTISNILNSLGLFELHFPPTACSLHFELYKPNENQHYMQIFYRMSNEEYPKAMEIPGCGNKITLERFFDLYKETLPNDLET
ncbi:Testicular acid phosphatase like [Pseudolycoriella hygida]|uniref:acid phosphatase n=1 Tax=Pseudolycoriella hygida TaxID=35572 RepID=A0A9Q0MPA3_9DIPT|nr:Testicular acid phosphatase like [Pseudolycoriella hygida]